LRLAWPAATSAAALAGLAALVAGVPLVLLYLVGSGNASPGALDNASGAGMVLHLAEHYQSARVPFRLTFLITGAEELGVLGASAYVRAAQSGGGWPSPRDVQVFNFDGVGGDGPLAYVGGPAAPLAQSVRAACADLNLPLRRLPLVGALFDHLPFADAGLDALSLVTTGASARAVHTPADTPNRLSLAGFSQAWSVVQHVLAALAPVLPNSSSSPPQPPV
jgi:Zn-dependent M28 family amino/carboxypeptidase